MWVGAQRHAPAALPPVKTRYPLYRRLGGPQGRSGLVRKISLFTRIRSPERPARRESLYRLSYPDPLIQSGARKTGPPSRRPTWALVSDSVQEIKQMQMQSTYWLEKVLKMISLYVSALLCTLQHAAACTLVDSVQSLYIKCLPTRAQVSLVHSVQTLYTQCHPQEAVCGLCPISSHIVPPQKIARVACVYFLTHSAAPGDGVCRPLPILFPQNSPDNHIVTLSYLAINTPGWVP